MHRRPDDGPDEAELKRGLASTFAAEGVDPSYIRFVLQHVARPDREWRTCCNSSCDPCVDRLGRVVDRARELLGMEPPTE